MVGHIKSTIFEVIIALVAIEHKYSGFVHHIVLISNHWHLIS